jgi:hypothetical protein
MPRPEFGPEDYENPDAPEDEQRIRADHPAVRDLSYDEGRSRQYLDLWKQSLVATALDPWEETDPHRDDAQPGPSLELFIKERPRGRGYVRDFVYPGTIQPHRSGCRTAALECRRCCNRGVWVTGRKLGKSGGYEMTRNPISG